MQRLLLGLIAAWISGGVGAETYVDLNGLRLWQFQESVKKSLGEPDQTAVQGESDYHVYYIGDTAYTVLEYWKKRPNNIHSIQITGKTSDMLPFAGLKLGASRAEVVAALGEPSSTKQIDDPKVTLFSYDNTNLSVELAADDTLYSIRIGADKAVMEDVDFNFNSWEAFKRAVLAKDVNKLMTTLRPDVEIYKQDKLYNIDRRYADFLAQPSAEFMAALLADKDSVRAELLQTEPDGEMRLLEGVGVGLVYKFRKGKILREIVFFPYNGQHRVYEIAFRNADGS